jgi:phospholipid/cholesterol/gamma-HCH transport system substrate-binding protein
MALLAVVVVILATGGNGYTVTIRFDDAGQLVPGDLVEVAGIPVGTVTSLNLSRDDQAEVTVAMRSRRFIPLHQGTAASIGTVGLSGVTNRFVALSPGPRTRPAIAPGGTLPQTATMPIVDLDEILDTLTPPVRANLRRFVQGSAGVLRGNVAGARTTLDYAAAALQRTDALVSEVVSDRPAFSDLLATGARTASTLAARHADLTKGVADTASALAAIAQARGSLASLLQRVPAVLADGDTVLTRLRPTLAALDPVLSDARPVAAPLATVLRRIVPTARAATPVLHSLDSILPGVKVALADLPGLSRVGVPAIAGTVTALHRAEPVFTGLRPYGEDILLGFLHGYGGGSAENYDANGQFSRIALGLPASTLLTALLGENLPELSPHLLTGQTDKCPGSAAEPAADGSNHIVVAGCDPKQVP